MNELSKENKIKWYAGDGDFVIEIGSKFEIVFSWLGKKFTAITCDMCKFDNIHYINLCFIKVGICFKYYEQRSD